MLQAGKSSSDKLKRNFYNVGITVSYKKRRIKNPHRLI